MADRIKGIIVEIGGDTTGLSKSLSGVNKSISSTQSELRDVERLLKLDPTNTNLLEQRQRLLAQAVNETKTKLDALKQAETQVQEQFKDGKVSRQQYEALQREITATEQNLKNLESQAKRSNETLSKISAASKKISDNANKVSSAMKPVTTAIVGLGAAAVATVPATEELRSDLSKLDQNAKENAVAVDQARLAWEKFAVASDETDSAVEATANLLQAGFTESNLQKAVEGLTGAYLRFPDTLKIEGLADSLQETLATGSAIGQFGELLDRLGIGADNFTEKLQEIADPIERQNYALQTLADAGLNDTYNGWIENNKAMTDSKKANLDLQQAMAELAETVQPILTKVVDKIADLLKWFNNLDDKTKTIILTVLGVVAAIGPIAKLIGGISTVIGFLSGTVIPALGTALNFLAANPIVAVIAAIAAVVAIVVTLWNKCEWFRDAVTAVWEWIKGIFQSFSDWLNSVFSTDWSEKFGVFGEILNAFFASVKNIWDGIKNIFRGIIDFIKSVFTGNWQGAWEGVKRIFKGIFDSLVGIVKAPINGIIGLLNGAIDGINWLVDGVNKVTGIVGIPQIPDIPNIPYLAKGGTLSSGSAIVGEAGPELLTMIGGKTRVTPLTNGQKQQGAYLGGGINIYIDHFVNNDTSKDINQLTETIMEKIEHATQRKAAVFK